MARPSAFFFLMADSTLYMLIAEDNEDHYQLIREALSEGDHRFDSEWVKNGEQLLQRLANDPLPDLILLDLNLPLLDGREALRVIKNTIRLRRIPIIVLTTSRSREDVNQAYHSGANAVLLKPAGFEELAKRLNAFANFWLRHVEFPTKTKVTPANNE